MFKSVFWKYILGFLIILALSFTVLTMIISALIVSYSSDERQEVMQRITNVAGEFIRSGYKNSLYTFNRYIEDESDVIKNGLAEYTKFAENSFIFITDSDGVILVSTNEDVFLKEEVPSYITETVKSEREISRFQTLGDVFAEKHLIHAREITLVPSDETVGIIFVCSTSTTMDKFIRAMISTVIMSCLWVLIATMVVVYFITEKIIAPIRTMNKAAKSFATGHFDVRVSVQGNDEIADLAAAFNNMAASLAKNEETHRNFVSNVSHDLRTPMTSIGGYIGGILDGTIPEDKHKYYLGVIASEIKRLSRLVSSMLDITRMQAGEFEFSKKNFDICETARRVLLSFEAKIDEKKIDVEFDCDEENIYVYADVDAVHRILQNILENAIKFTNETGIIKINIKIMAQNIQVSIYNTGEGIYEEDLPHVFDRFYKSDLSRGLDKTGVGLGLFIVKTMIDSHEEQIWVNSEHGKYCEFVFTLQKVYNN